MQLLSLDHELIKNDTNTPLYLSGSKLISNSQVNNIILSPLPIIIQDFSSDHGQDNLGMEEPISSDPLTMAIETMNFN